MSDQAILEGFKQLETYIREGFDHVDGRFERIERRLDRVEVQLIDLEQKIDGMDGRLERVVNCLHVLEQRV